MFAALIRHAVPMPARSAPCHSVIARFESHWLPRKRLSRQAMNDLRQLNRSNPEEYSIDALAEKFHVSHDAVKRILKSNFKPDATVARRQESNRYKAMGERQRAFRKQ